MPLPKRPYVASADQIRITRDGDVAVIEYADDAVAATRLAVGAERLATMSDDELLEFWNESVRTNREGGVSCRSGAPRADLDFNGGRVTEDPHRTVRAEKARQASAPLR